MTNRPERKEEVPQVNTDKTIWTQPTTDFGPEDGNDRGMEPKVIITEDNCVGFEYYGFVCIKPIKEWVRIVKQELLLEELERKSDLGSD